MFSFCVYTLEFFVIRSFCMSLFIQSFTRVSIDSGTVILCTGF